MIQAEQFTPVCTFHGEGPLWDARRERLLLVDLLAGAVVEVDAGGAVARHEVDRVVAALRPRRQGGFIAALERGLALLDERFRVQERFPVELPEGVRFNDGGCDPRGRFYIGSMAYDFTEGAAALYRLGSDGRLHVAVDAVTISNGIQWSADGALAYYNDTATGRVDVFDADPATGALSNRRVHARIEGPGAPDGMAIDVEGGLWVALWGGGAVVRIDPDGTVSERIALPVPQVTACAFGADGSRLFITTSRDGAPDEALGSSGAVFACSPGVRGATVHAYAG